MSVATLRLVSAVFWLVVAVGLLVRPVGPAAPMLGPALALMFAALNLARWRQAKARSGVQPRRQRPASGEYHPEFDFESRPHGDRPCGLL
jgi:uncharacterized membrane protein